MFIYSHLNTVSSGKNIHVKYDSISPTVEPPLKRPPKMLCLKWWLMGGGRLHGSSRDPCANANAVFSKSQLIINFEKRIRFFLLRNFRVLYEQGIQCYNTLFSIFQKFGICFFLVPNLHT